MEFLETDSQFTNPEVKRLSDLQKSNARFNGHEAGWNNFLEALELKDPAVIKSSDFESLRKQEMFSDILGELPDQHGFLKPIMVKSASINLDDLEKRASTPHEKLAVRLMKVGKATGSPSEEMQRFFDNYKHLAPTEIQAAVKAAIQCVDIPLFFRLMGEVVSMSFS